ncbi:hydroxymethylglutaryl-CoA reductase [Levilactobacillus koreensis JCM 16448]|uniref:3-hydroxy-3-methylglutaryl coenzyme A reductase n=1 Tax=Levilactobacillus koreensis TaxID=637971 RepID=A0AAC9EQX0_9LACO|nr:hydroxymethylglutaryl-CoA reductase, degradative [Levilactobacillus koreensis]AKP63989.1 3-hydroxy-3-methylglutaryl-CoA reductase [Levilactobacillus koreensis]KRK86416.1 hydroxymethylglutaryl-CoA reductase [Levilactobacillus koreensis JCM 16448]
MTAFYRLPYGVRRDQLARASHLTVAQLALLAQHRQATDEDLIENYLTTYGLPEGVAVNLRVNGRDVVVPMVTEEPSVIAAASNGGRLLTGDTGITTTITRRELMGQIVFSHVQDPQRLQVWLASHEQELLQVADAAHPTLLTHGGGARSLRVRILPPDWVSLDLFIDVGEAMGANLVNTLTEAVAAKIKASLDVDILMSILSNYATHSLVTASCAVPVDQLKTKTIAGAGVAQRIAEASDYAQVDPYRAVTHNKGIMNGIDAVVLAMGNDWRAVESGVHAYASRNGSYQGLSRWWVSAGILHGELTIPLALGFVGGATKVLPLVKINQQLAQVDNARDLMGITAAVGLAQNVAALRALVTDGIQRGHMSLQRKSLALSVGATPTELPAVTQRLAQFKQPTTAQATAALRAVRQANLKK